MKKHWNKIRRLVCLAIILSLVLPFAGPATVLPASAVTQAEVDALKVMPVIWPARKRSCKPSSMR